MTIRSSEQHEHDKKGVLGFVYRNHRGEVAHRKVLPLRVYRGGTNYHQGDQWLLEAHCLDRNETRTFALVEVQSWDDGSPFALAGMMSHEADVNGCLWGQEVADRFIEQAEYQEELAALRRRAEKKADDGAILFGPISLLTIVSLGGIIVMLIIHLLSGGVRGR